MDNTFYLTDENGLREAYLGASRELLAPSYQRHLSNEQIAGVIREAMGNLPPMERQAFADLSLRMAEDVDWGSIVKSAAPLIGAAFGGPAGAAAGALVGNLVGQSDTPPPPVARPRNTKPPRRRPSATTSSSTQFPPPPAAEPSADPVTANQIIALLSNPQVLQAIKQAIGNSTTNNNAATLPANASAATPAVSGSADPKTEYFSEAVGTPMNVSWLTKPAGVFTPPAVMNTSFPKTTAAPSPDPRYWYYDQNLKQWRRRPVAPPPVANTPDPRYYYYDTGAKAWRRRPATTYVPPRIQVPTYAGQSYPYPAYPVPTPVNPFPEPALNTAASQLLALINNPQFSQAMLGQVLGNVGSGNATVQQGNELVDIPFGALMNALVELGQQAAEESVKLGAEESERYLMDNEGNYKIDDPSKPEERAKTVMEMLREDYEYRNEKAEKPPETIDPVTEWLVSAGMVG